MKNVFDQFATDQPAADVALDDVVIDIPVGTKVPNVFPKLTGFPYKIAIIGEAPGRDEELVGEPFVGMSGKLLTGMLAKAGIVRDACFIGNVCQYRPPNNDIANFNREGEQIQEGLALLSKDLNEFKPHVCLLLGKTALWAFSGIDKIGDWRGSLGVGQQPFPYKYIPSYHPAACLRQYDWTAYLWFDLLKCLSEATKPDLTLPSRELISNPTYEELITLLDDTDIRPRLVSTDIEGGIASMSCCSFSDSPERSFIIPFVGLDGSHIWMEEREVEIWRRFIRVLTNTTIPKVFQNGLYDRFVLAYSYQITVRGCVDDTMLKWAEWLCEMEKGLAVQTSILTNEPFYKFERKSTTKEDFYRYCCKDSAVTYEINEKLSSKLDPAQMAHYRLNNALLNPILYMELRGILYDTKQAKIRLSDINTHIYTLQSRLDSLAGCGLDVTLPREQIINSVRNIMCYKRDTTMPKKEFAEDYAKVIKLLSSESRLTPQDIGYINIACKWSMNIKSDKFKTYLYSTLKLPIQYDPKTKQPTTDYEALLKISKKQPHVAVEIALELGELRTRSQMLEIKADGDGRIRCGYNIVGTETGRITCYTSPTGSGYNLQTIPDKNSLKTEGNPLRDGLRNLFIADPGHYLFQCDLSGADGWTVGAHLASLGDPTMLDDLRFGLKPAAVICYMLRHGNQSLVGKQRGEIKELLKEISKESWDYFACKCGIWGTCYTMGPRKLSDLILIQSEGKVVMDEQKCRVFQQAIFQRYNVHLWHRAMERRLKQRKELVSPNGHRRRFFGRGTDILGQALAHEPQVNTTYATNMAMYKLWNDNENRRLSTLSGSGQDALSCPQRQMLRIEPLHTVHDALLGQFKITDTDWAINRIKTYFDNQIAIAGIPITIPFSGSYGVSWGDLTKGTI